MNSNHPIKEQNEYKEATEQSTPIADVTPIRKGFAVTVISLFAALLILPGLIWGGLQLFASDLAERLNFDTGENRALAAFPENFNPQTVTSEIESWYNDHLPFRSVLYKAQKDLDHALEQPYTETLRPALIKLFYGNTQVSPGPGNNGVFDPFGTEESRESETLPEFLDETDASDCEHVYSDEPLVITEATCTEYGVVGYACTKCEYIKQEYAPKIAHQLTSNHPELPGCGEKYQETLTCSVCGHSETNTLEKTHRHEKNVRVVKASSSSYGYTLTRCRDCNGLYRTNLQDKLYDTGYLPPQYYGEKKYVIQGRDKWLFYRGDNSEGYYQGTNLLSEEELAEYLETLTALKEICDEKKIRLVIAVFPNKDQVYSEYMPTYTVETDYKRVARWVDYINENSDVDAVYPLEQLIAAKPYFELYYKYDTHWNAAGAFIGYQEILRALGYQTTNLYNLPMTEKTVTTGDMFNIGGLNQNAYISEDESGGNVTYDIAYRPEVKIYREQYSGNQKFNGLTKSNGAIRKNFVMLSDSYRSAILSHAKKDFTSCFFTHRSEIQDPAVITAIKRADILCLSAVERYDYQIIETAKEVIKILSGTN